MGRLVIHCTATGEDLVTDAPTLDQAMKQHDAINQCDESITSRTISTHVAAVRIGLIGLCRTRMECGGIVTIINAPFTFYELSGAANREPTPSTKVVYQVMVMKEYEVMVPDADLAEDQQEALDDNRPVWLPEGSEWINTTAQIKDDEVDEWS